MPNASISIYLSDEDYATYSKHKKDLNATVRDIFKKDIKRLSDED